MIQNLICFNGNGNIYAYKNPKGKNAALAEFVVDRCLSDGRLTNNKLLISSSGNLATEFAKVCRAKNIDFLPMVGVREDPVPFSKIAALGFNIDRTPMTEREEKIEVYKIQGWHYFDQFSDPMLIEHYKSAATQALSELGGLVPDIFIDFIGGGATFRGFYEVLNDRCAFGYANSCYRDEHKFERKVFVNDILKDNPKVQLVDVQGSLATNLFFRYQQGEFPSLGNTTRTFFTSVQGALNWLNFNPSKTVLLHWED